MRNVVLFAFLIGLAPFRPAEAALPQDPNERAYAFATCLGRYMAVADYAEFYGQDREEARARRDLFAMLLDTVTADAQQSGMGWREIVQYRIGAKQAQSRLTRLARFEMDDTRATTAANMARRAVRMCDALI
jgi:hypothetical protein